MVGIGDIDEKKVEALWLSCGGAHVEVRSLTRSMWWVWITCGGCFRVATVGVSLWCDAERVRDAEVGTLKRVVARSVCGLIDLLEVEKLGIRTIAVRNRPTSSLAVVERQAREYANENPSRCYFGKISVENSVSEIWYFGNIPLASLWHKWSSDLSRTSVRRLGSALRAVLRNEAVSMRVSSASDGNAKNGPDC